MDIHKMVIKEQKQGKTLLLASICDKILLRHR